METWGGKKASISQIGFIISYDFRFLSLQSSASSGSGTVLSVL